MTTAVTTPHLPNAAGVDLEDWGALEEATGPAMQTRGRTLAGPAPGTSTRPSARSTRSSSRPLSGAGSRRRRADAVAGAEADR